MAGVVAVRLPVGSGGGSLVAQTDSTSFLAR